MALEGGVTGDELFQRGLGDADVTQGLVPFKQSPVTEPVDCLGADLEDLSCFLGCINRVTDLLSTCFHFREFLLQGVIALNSAPGTSKPALSAHLLI